MMGARRHLADLLNSPLPGVAEKALRQAPNFEIQGSAAEMTKLAMARVWASGVLMQKDVIFIAQVHDELVFSVAIDDALEVIKTIHSAMVADYSTLPVPILGSISLGKSLGEQIETGDWYIESSIIKALDQCRPQMKLAA
jgi:DNA polymerase-1